MCPKLTAPKFGFINFATDKTDPYELGTNATYTCISRYQLNVSNNSTDKQYVRSCVGNYSSSVGRWNGFDPICISESTLLLFENRIPRISLTVQCHVYIAVLARVL